MRVTSKHNKAILVDSSENEISTVLGDDGSRALSVHTGHIQERLENHFFSRKLATSTTLTVAGAPGDRTIAVASAVGLAAGGFIDILVGSDIRHMHRKIISVAALIIELDVELDTTHPIGSTVQLISMDMNVDGSVTPVKFSVAPKSGFRFLALRMLIIMTHSSAATDDKFGNLTALTRGVHVRKNNNDTSYNTLTVWRENHAMKSDMYDVMYTDKAGASLFGTHGRWTFEFSGAIIALTSADSETLECIIQDDLTSLDAFHLKLQGHEGL